MFGAITLTFFTIVYFTILFICPAYMAQGVLQIKNGVLYTSDKVKSYIPLYNIFVSESEYRGGIPFAFITTVITVVIFVARVILTIMFPQSIDMLITTLMIFAVFALISYFANVMLVYGILSLDPSEDKGFGFYVRVLFYPIGQYYIGTTLYKVLQVYNNSDLEV